MNHLIKHFALEMQKISSPKTPESTDTYTVIPHAQLVDTIKNKASERLDGIPFLSTTLTKDGGQMSGTLSFPVKNNHTGIAVAFANSYNKRVKVLIAGGGYTWICGNGSIFGDITTARKHTGSAMDVICENIDIVLDKVEEDYNGFIEKIKLMDEVSINNLVASRILGELRYNKSILSEREAAAANREWIRPTHFQERSLWGLYNACNGSLRSHHPTSSIHTHRRLYDHFSDTTDNMLKL